MEGWRDVAEYYTRTNIVVLSLEFYKHYTNTAINTTEIISNS